MSCRNGGGGGGGGGSVCIGVGGGGFLSLSWLICCCIKFSCVVSAEIVLLDVLKVLLVISDFSSDFLVKGIVHAL